MCTSSWGEGRPLAVDVLGDALESAQPPLGAPVAAAWSRVFDWQRT